MKTATDNPVEITVGLRSNGCGHTILMTREHYDACKADGRTWFCTVCGCSRVFVGETEAAKLRRERDAALQREETLRFERDQARLALVKKSKEAQRLKKRVAAGVCPCCTRSFQNLRRHMATKHPEHASSE